eukprot:3596844-Ditylum_brightwellii.AAC.1
MEEVDGRSRMSEESPPMNSPIIDLVGYTGVTDRADQILLGTSPNIPGIDKYNQLYIDQLRSVEGCLPESAKPVSFQQYHDEVKQLRERTSSSPSNVSPAMIKIELSNPILADVNWKASNFPWCTGYSPSRFRSGLDLLIHKRNNENRVNKLRPILLFGIEANMHNKMLSKDAMRRAEACGGVASEQFGSQRNKSAGLHALNAHLFYDHVLLQKIPSTSVFIDLVSNYDLVVHNIASLALQRVGVPKAPICCTFTTIQDM